MKICRKCKYNKPKTEFRSNKELKDGLHSWCKACDKARLKESYLINKDKRKLQNKQWAINNQEKLKAYQKSWYLQNKDKVQKTSKVNYIKNRNRHKVCSRKNHLLRKFKMSIEDYENRLKAQNFCCKICNKHIKDEGKHLAVDHCHITGVVRGLLCRSCNTGIGKLKDSIELLKKAQLYIENKGEI